MNSLYKARLLAQIYDVRTAATFLRRRGYSLRITLWLLLKAEERD